jgi:hypothetical protein
MKPKSHTWPCLRLVIQREEKKQVEEGEWRRRKVVGEIFTDYVRSYVRASKEQLS